MPSLEQIPEVPEEFREPARLHIPVFPLRDSPMDSRPFNFSRPRPLTSNPSSALTSPVLEKSQSFGNGHQFHIHQPYQSQAAKDSDKSPVTRYLHNDEHDDDDHDDAAPFPVVRTCADTHDVPLNFKSSSPQTWIYKPYADSVVSSRDSDGDSFLSDDTMTTEDTVSIAESTTTGYSEATDYAFDGRLGWNPTQRPSQAERERQRWAAPALHQKQDEKQKPRSFPPHMGYREPEDLHSGSKQIRRQVSSDWDSADERRSWLSDSSTGTVTTHGSGGHSNGRTQPGANVRKAHQDVLEAAAERRNNFNTPAHGTYNVTPGQLGRSLSQGTDRTSYFNIKPQASPSTNLHRDNSNGSAMLTRPGGVTANSFGSLNSEDWKSSEVDVSSLSAEKIRKLEKKGINPALYLEMKQARNKGGKKRSTFGVLTGNSFLS